MRYFSTLLCFALITASVAKAENLIGAQFNVRNTIQVDEPLASAFGLPPGVEADFTPTTGPYAVTSGDTTELSSYVTLYDINFDESSVVFSFNPTPDSQKTPRVLETGTFDRYYFDFTFPDASTRIDAVSFDASNSNVLAEATATPTATLLSDSSFMLELGPGNAVLPGFVHAYSVNVVPEPAASVQRNNQ